VGFEGAVHGDSVCLLGLELAGIRKGKRCLRGCGIDIMF
jgi:hypothetical protein